MKRALALVLMSAACGGGARYAPTVLVPAPVEAPPVVVVDAGALEEGLVTTEVVTSDWAICVRASGRVHCSNGLADSLTSAPALAGIDDAVQLVLGGRFGCVLTQRGTVFCFGSNQHGELGAGLSVLSSETPVEVRGLRGVKRIAAGRAHACAQIETGALFCWGANENGETGSETAYTTEVRELVTPTAVRVPPVRAFAAGGSATCAVTKEQQVYCWGVRVLPEHITGNGDSCAPSHATSLTGAFTDIVAGEDAFCVLRGQEHLCWGTSYSLFTEYRGATRPPQPLALPALRRIALASSHGCALSFDGTVRCFGSNWSGALGRETGDDHTSSSGPELVPDLPRARDVMVGGEMSCAVVIGGDVYCWGTWPSGRRRESKPVKLAL